MLRYHAGLNLPPPKKKQGFQFISLLEKKIGQKVGNAILAKWFILVCFIHLTKIKKEKRNQK